MHAVHAGASLEDAVLRFMDKARTGQGLLVRQICDAVAPRGPGQAYFTKPQVCYVISRDDIHTSWRTNESL